MVNPNGGSHALHQQPILVSPHPYLRRGNSSEWTMYTSKARVIASSIGGCEGKIDRKRGTGRRQLLSTGTGMVVGQLAAVAWPRFAWSVVEELPSLAGKDYGKTRTVYPDFELRPSGLQYKDIVVGTGKEARLGDDVVIDWAGCTIGYYARIFEARNKAKGGSFAGDDKEYLRFRVGNEAIIPAFNEALQGMKVGGIRRIIVSPGTDLGYPDDSFDKGIGPRPTTFSGRRALSFVLGNQGLIDKSLLFDIELIKVP
eukprot:scaffold762_cov363-Pavlova_lutheri.AAC.56